MNYEYEFQEIKFGQLFTVNEYSDVFIKVYSMNNPFDNSYALSLNTGKQLGFDPYQKVKTNIELVFKTKEESKTVFNSPEELEKELSRRYPFNWDSLRNNRTIMYMHRGTMEDIAYFNLYTNTGGIV